MNCVASGGGMADNPSGVVKPSPVSMNSSTEEQPMLDRHIQQSNFQSYQPNSQSHVQQREHPMMGNQDGPEFSRAMASQQHTQQHLPQPHVPRASNNFGGGDQLVHDQGNFAMLRLIHNAPMTMDIHKIPEAISLQAALNSGQVAPSVLLHQVSVGTEF